MLRIAVTEKIVAAKAACRLKWADVAAQIGLSRYGLRQPVLAK